MVAASCTAASILANGMAVVPGSTVTASGWWQAATSGRAVNVGVDFYDSTGTYLSTGRGPNVTTNTLTFVQPTALITAPANAAACRLNAQVIGTGAGGEVHYLDDVFLAVTQWQPSHRCVVGPNVGELGPV